MLFRSNGVVANVVLRHTKGHNTGWIVITTGWACAAAVSVYLVNAVSGAHLNPAVTIALAAIGKFPWLQVPAYVAAQMLGAIAGSVLVWLAYLPHWAETEDPAAKLACFATAPAIRRPLANLVTEAIATAVLVLGVLAILRPENLVPNTGFDKGFSPLLVGLLVWLQSGALAWMVPPHPAGEPASQHGFPDAPRR